ncbi:hypothetical protein FisN_7Lh396 [Fistulifera solaris]|uniref:Uncharacterized protein n=1 Tax=Fistulifera solaris TaxID=1519565 RepID=A0A1Z5JBB7_FISSO|nr:hypothetical protein FisN_7Lh396 [Fistulifera solaris]|eukprot:GAX11290.1 hypothetical protein FisN_7Lh396 [Fistulifera solaris]
MRMTKLQSFLTFLLTIACCVSVIRKYQVLNDYWNRALEDVEAAYVAAHDLCLRDERELCESVSSSEPSHTVSTPQMDAWTLTLSLERDSAPHMIQLMDSSIEKRNIPDSAISPTSSVPSTTSSAEPQYLRTATSRRHLTEDFIESQSYPLVSTTFPSDCLQTAWIEQNVHPSCSRALHHWQDIATMLQHQKCTARWFKAFYGAFWGMLLLVWYVMYWIFRSSDLEEIEILLLKHSECLHSCGSCYCCATTCCVKNAKAISPPTPDCENECCKTLTGK